MSIPLHKKIYFSLVLGVMCLPSFVFASVVSIDTKETNLYVGDNVIFNVRLNSEGKEINAMDGMVALQYTPSSITVSDISIAGSAFSLWPRRPSLSADKSMISFVGGVPKGLASGDALVFKIILNLNQAGDIVLKPTGINVYVNDGKGTLDPVTFKDLKITVLPKPEGFESRKEWTTIVSADRTPPEPFEIFLGQDSSAFDGKKFISFNAIDTESGIDHYEVKEGDLPPSRSSGTYVLKNQDTRQTITVTAFDVAGNTREVIYDTSGVSTVPSKTPITTILYTLLVLLLIAGLIVFFKKRKRKGDVPTQN